LRIIDWLSDFSWYEKIFPFTNPPAGEILHFTRINDVIWVILSLPFIPFFPLKDAIFYGGMLFSPLFLLLSYISVIWGIRPYFSQYPKKENTFTLAFILGLIWLYKLNSIFDFNRPDHHSLMFFIFCFNISAVLRQRLFSGNKALFFAGILAGCGIWASSAIEGLILVACILTVLTINWLFYDLPITKTATYCRGLFVATLAAYLLNPPYAGYWAVDNFRLSVMHVVLVFLIAVSFEITAYIKPKSVYDKIICLATFAVCSALTMLMIFGFKQLTRPVYTEVASKYFIPEIAEMRHASWFDFISFSIIPTACGILFFHYKIKTYLLINLLVMLLFYLPFACLICRFCSYTQTVSVYFIFVFLFETSKSEDLKNKLIEISFITLNIFFLSALRYEPKYMDTPAVEGTVLTDLFVAPRLIYQQNVKSVDSPYHNNNEGILDAQTMFFTSDEQTLKELIKKHSVTYIYLPEEYASTRKYKLPEKNTDKLYGKIITDKNVYEWLENKSVDQKYRLYKVNYDKF
jgi:hypothetical protein